MPAFQLKRHGLYVLAAIVLLLQSFAVWHDATHPFHANEVQCERLHAINHLPGADLLTEVDILHHFISVSIELVYSIPTLPLRQREQHPIRAPPIYL